MAGGDAIYPLHLNKPRGHPIKGRLRGVEMTWGGSGKRPCGGGGKTAKGPLVLGGEVLLDIVQEGSGGFGEIFFVPRMRGILQKYFFLGTIDSNRMTPARLFLMRESITLI